MTESPPAPPDPTAPGGGGDEPCRTVVTGAEPGINRATAVAPAAPGRGVGVTRDTDREGAMAGAHPGSHDGRRP